MDITQNRNIDKVIILGSGESILKLSTEEISYINNCKVVIALNKYMAFYKLSKILPTHIYFVDNHENNLKFIKHIIEICENDNLENLTFIFSKKIKIKTYKKKIEKFTKRLLLIIFHFLRSIKRNNFQFLKDGLKDVLYIKLSKKNKYYFIQTNNWLEGGDWANSLKSNLYHYRGSLTTALNFVSICYPNKEINLVGNDFYGSNYFFENELEKLPFNWKDWTFQNVKSEGLHFSFQNYDGKKITDCIPFILKSLSKSNNLLFCNNINSLLVTEGNIKYKSLL